jgi:hypothetical protein
LENNPEYREYLASLRTTLMMAEQFFPEKTKSMLDKVSNLRRFSPVDLPEPEVSKLSKLMGSELNYQLPDSGRKKEISTD